MTMDHETHIAHLDGVIADQRAEIERLRSQLEAKEAECTLLAASLRKAETALRPFAGWQRKYGAEVIRMLYHGDMIGPHPARQDFARAAELVPQEAKP